jgi:hypothetical protein
MKINGLCEISVSLFNDFFNEYGNRSVVFLVMGMERYIKLSY